MSESLLACMTTKGRALLTGTTTAVLQCKYCTSILRGIVFFSANTNHWKYWIRWGLLPQQGGLARDTHRAECALSTAPIRKGVNAETTAYAKLGGWDGHYFSCNPLLFWFFCLARLEQSNDRVGVRYMVQDIGKYSRNHHSSCDCCNFVVPDFTRSFGVTSNPGMIKRATVIYLLVRCTRYYFSWNTTYQVPGTRYVLLCV